MGPNAGGHVRVALPDVAAHNEDVYEVRDRFPLEGLSIGHGRADSHGSSEVIGGDYFFSLSAWRIMCFWTTPRKCWPLVISRQFANTSPSPSS